MISGSCHAYRRAVVATKQSGSHSSQTSLLRIAARRPSVPARLLLLLMVLWLSSSSQETADQLTRETTAGPLATVRLAATSVRALASYDGASEASKA